jgi:hypothetical protein
MVMCMYMTICKGDSMAASERVVVLMTPEQKKTASMRARAQNLSLSDYMRRQALGEDELLATLLSELEASTDAARGALDEVLNKLSLASAERAEIEARAREKARAEFADVDLEALEGLMGGSGAQPGRKRVAR